MEELTIAIVSGSIGILGALIGSLATYVVGFKLEQRKWRQDERVRLQSERLRCYQEVMVAFSRAIIHTRGNDERDCAAAGELLSAVNAVELVGSPSVRSEAVVISLELTNYLLSDDAKFPTEAVATARRRLLDEARKELGSDRILCDPVPVARSVQKSAN